MKKQKNTIRNMAFAATAVCSVAAAHASVDYQIGNGGLGTFRGSIDGTSISGLAGGIKLTEQGSPVSGAPTVYTSVCTDIEGVLYLGQTYAYNTPTTFAAASPSTGLDPTWGALNTPTDVKSGGINQANAAQAIQNAAYIFYHYGTGGGTLTGTTGISGTTDQLEALQLAIWAALYDTTTSGSVNLTGGRFTFSGVSSTIVNDVNNYLLGLTGDYNFSGYLVQPDSTQYGKVPQEWLYGINPQSSFAAPVPVPEPSTIIAGALLVLPLAASTMRILRRRQAE
jgi:hypothetical protein